MKILCLCSALDLKFRYGCTPAWWQFFKGMYELGHEVIAVPYQGSAIESPWWRVYPNPCQAEGTAYAAAKKFLGGKVAPGEPGFGSEVSKKLIEHWIRPRWDEHLTTIFRQEKDIAAVVVFTIPVNHITGLPARIRERFGVPVYYYDGDVPASLPRFGGFASGFKIYDGGDLSEYDGVLCNSRGGAEDLAALGAHHVETVYWGVDPDLYAPVDVEQDWDVFFYGYGAEYREKWIEAMLTNACRELRDNSFHIGGQGFTVSLGDVKREGDIPFSIFRNACCRSKINLNITRDAHATVNASSSMRPFELAATGSCIVSNPVEGMDAWFTPGEELIIVNSEAEAIDAYKTLLADPERRKAMGEAARARVLAEHTHRHRAQQIIDYLHATD